MEEIVGETAVEGFAGLGGEVDGALPDAGTAVIFFAACEDGVDALAVEGGDVLDVGNIFILKLLTPASISASRSAERFMSRRESRWR